MSHDGLYKASILQASRHWRRASSNTQNKRHPPVNEFSQICKRLVWTVLCRAMHLFSTVAVLCGIANAHKRLLYSGRSHLQVPSSRKWRELLFSFLPTWRVLQTPSHCMQKEKGTSLAVLCDKRVTWTQSPWVSCPCCPWLHVELSMSTKLRCKPVPLQLRAKCLYLFAGPC